MRKYIPESQHKSLIIHKTLPALLQSTLKLFFWPTKALVRPRPLATTRLASDAACWLVVTLRVMGSTITDEVSCMLWLLTRRDPVQEWNVPEKCQWNTEFIELVKLRKSFTQSLQYWTVISSQKLCCNTVFSETKLDCRSYSTVTLLGQWKINSPVIFALNGLPTMW